jgi:hypothetical protein
MTATVPTLSREQIDSDYHIADRGLEMSEHGARARLAIGRLRSAALSALASRSGGVPDGYKLVPVEIARGKHRHVLEVWNRCMADCETLEMAWPKLVKAMEAK